MFILFYQQRSKFGKSTSGRIVLLWVNHTLSKRAGPSALEFYGTHTVSTRTTKFGKVTDMGKGRVSKDQLHSLTTRNGGSTPKFWDSNYVYSV